jgi:hypothetical protein
VHGFHVLCAKALSKSTEALIASSHDEDSLEKEDEEKHIKLVIEIVGLSNCGIQAVVSWLDQERVGKHSFTTGENQMISFLPASVGALGLS